MAPHQWRALSASQRCVVEVAGQFVKLRLGVGRWSGKVVSPMDVSARRQRGAINFHLLYVYVAQATRNRIPITRTVDARGGRRAGALSVSRVSGNGIGERHGL